MRAVIYTRYSTSLQSAKSIEDQEALCRSYAQLRGYEVIRHYSDAARSGASRFGRDGLNELLVDAQRGKFNAIIVEELDRLSRDMEDLAGFYKRLKFLNIELDAVHGGVADTASVGLRGLVGQMYREDNAHKIRRGLAGKVRSGHSAGGAAYGYKPDPINKGVLHIIEEQAQVVRRIFEEFATGASPRQIAHRLNRDNVPPPRGQRWNASAILGWEQRSSGILRNRLYSGWIVWNKIRMVKDPDTGRRVSRPNPPDQWEIREEQALRIVPHELFEAVQSVLGGRARTPQEAGAMKRQKRLLSGLLKCAACGAGVSLKGKDPSGRDRIQCSAHAQSRTCPDPHTFYLDVVEDLVLDTLRVELKDPRRLATYVQAYNEARQEYARTTACRRSGLEKRIAALDVELDRLVAFIAKGTGNPDRIGREMTAKEIELQELKAELALEPEPLDPVVLHPFAILRYEQQLDRLREELEEDLTSGNTRAAEVMRELIESITVSANPETRKGVSIQIKGKLRSLIEAPLPKAALGGAMVAEEGFEPPTQGL